MQSLSASERIPFIVKGTELVHPGVTFGPKNPTLLYSNDMYAVVRVHGHTGWCSRGSTAYYPAELYLVRIKWSEDESRFHEVETLEHLVPGRQSRKQAKRLIEKAQRLFAISNPE